MSQTTVVVGGDAAGMSAASKLKREDPDAEVIVFEKGQWVSYAACGTPYYVKGVIDDVEDLVAVEPETFVEERDIDLRLGHEVVAIDTEAETVTVDGAGERFEQSYDDLLVATGAHAVEPPFEGFGLDGVFTLHGLDAAERIRAFVETESVDSVGVVGGGYVGIEMVEAFHARGFDVHLFEMLPHVLPPFGETVAEAVEGELDSKGVTLHLDTAVERFEGGDRVERVVADGASVSVDAVLVGVGVAPTVELAEEAGIETGETGAIAVDEYGRTNVENVYAAGDCAEAEHVVTGEPAHVPLALTANRSGRAIGQTLAGEPTPVSKTAGTAAVKALDLDAARTGILDESEAREAGFDPVSATITAPTRAHYYPGGEEITITLVADRTSERVLGAAMVGGEGVAKRVDTVATALSGGMTVDEVEELDLSYAPPFSPTWDPVLTAAKVLASKL
ncbi:MAG: FAD-dependent oxidoreductase [Haloferacaceae archaeon]